MDFRFDVNHYDLIVATEEENKYNEKIVGFEDNSNIICKIPNYLDNNKNGFYMNYKKDGTIEFDLKEDSPSIKFLVGLSEREDLFEITILDTNDNNKILIKGTSFKLSSSNNNTNWIIHNFHEQIQNN